MTAHLLISAERVSKTSSVARGCGRQGLAQPIGRPNITVIAYVRPPVSFMASAFQQAVRVEGRTDRRSRFWPGYRERFEKLDTVFGRENVR